MARGQGKVGEAKSEVIRQIPLACADEDEAVRFFERQRWPDGASCPREGCGSTEVYRMTGKAALRYLWRCRDCKRQFTVKVGTIMEDSPIHMRHWAYAFWAACAGKKGVAAKEIQRMTGLSYKSALFMMHRIRWAMVEGSPDMLAGDVEVDETYVGGKPRPAGMRSRKFMSLKHADRTGRAIPEVHYTKRKAPVMALVERNGNVRTRVLPEVRAHNLKQAIRDMVDPSARIMTDEQLPYRGIGREFKGGHHTVNHSQKEYARGDVHTNTAESFFSTLKRGMYGVYHNVSRRHLHRYVTHTEFLWNTRWLEDGQRVVRAIQQAEGRRLMYRRPVEG